MSDDKQNYTKYAGIVIQMALVIGLGVWSGITIDEQLKNETPIFTIVFSLLSVFLSIYLVLKDFIKKE